MGTEEKEKSSHPFLGPWDAVESYLMVDLSYEIDQLENLIKEVGDIIDNKLVPGLEKVCKEVDMNCSKTKEKIKELKCDLENSIEKIKDHLSTESSCTSLGNTLMSIKNELSKLDWLIARKRGEAKPEPGEILFVRRKRDDESH